MCRFIPASAGNTRHGRSRNWKTPVHPRVCGEHPSVAFAGSAPSGSSPRLRGTPIQPGCRFASPRFIPASAGNTRTTARASTTGPVHPRVCGEHACGEGRARVLVGSSPRLRGTRHQRRAPQRDGRFIPASAGNTCSGQGPRTCCAVHPRVCGEHPAFWSEGASISGSSPRLRGTLCAILPLSAYYRFIPASAGNTDPGRPGWCSRPVHPRVCGEHTSCLVDMICRAGSSPRLRGTLFFQ